MVYSAAFDPYGGTQKLWQNTYDPKLKFSGKEREPSSDIDYFGARYYDHLKYRFLSVDPLLNKKNVKTNQNPNKSEKINPIIISDALVNPQRWNLYSFNLNNPLVYIDPDGLWTYPTTSQPRENDRWGSGAYGASRDGGRRQHAGMDFSGNASSDVFAPMSGALECIDGGVRITGVVDGRTYSTIILHINVTAPCNAQIQEGQIIGTIQDLTSDYPGITNHAHVELYDVNNGQTTRANPADFIPQFQPNQTNQ